jgi:hypothetical protein
MLNRHRITRRLAALAVVATLGIGAVSFGFSTSPGRQADTTFHALKTRH